jgi:uncharacterized protein (DUF4415 family)
MKKAKSFPFESARRITPAETKAARKAIEGYLDVKRPRRGRPPKSQDKLQPVSIRLHPKALEWVRKEAKRRGVDYQTIINDVLLKKAA